MNLLDELKQIINHKKISTLFQPIISLKNGDVLGFEALSRGPKDSRLESPDKLFKIARENNLLFQLEKVCRENALREAKMLKNKYKIFLNVDPLVIYEQDFKKGITQNLLNKFSINKNNLVIELTEKTFLKKCNGIKKVIFHYKDQGFYIAIDDTGAGYSGLQSIVSISHDYVKIDRSLIHNVNYDNVKKSLLEAFLTFTEKINSQVIAEGIETRKELETLINLGVDYGQGYYIKRPHAKVEEPFNFNKKQIISQNDKSIDRKSIIGMKDRREKNIICKNLGRGLSWSSKH